MMTEALNRYWRICATGLCFSSFGLGGLILRSVAFPLLALMVRGQERRAMIAKHIVHCTFRSFVWLMKALGVLSYRVHGLEKLQREGLLVLANHPSLIDVVFLIALVERPNCIVKGVLARNPFTRGPIRAAGFLCNDLGPELIENCIASIRRGNNLIIFPEGTRTPATGEMRLQRGAANVAVRGRIDVTPVLIRCTPPTLGKGQKWYRVPDRRVHFDIEVRDDIAVDSFIDGQGEAIAVRQMTQHLSQYFQETQVAHA